MRGADIPCPDEDTLSGGVLQNGKIDVIPVTFSTDQLTLCDKK